MLRILFVILSAMAGAVFLYPAEAKATDLVLVRERPTPMQMMPVGAVIIVLTFDRPVDHRGATLWLVSSDGQVRRITARLEAEPSTLYAALGRLRPGRYELHWTVKSLNGSSLNGILPFGVWNTMRISDQRHR